MTFWRFTNRIIIIIIIIIWVRVRVEDRRQPSNSNSNLQPLTLGHYELLADHMFIHVKNLMDLKNNDSSSNMFFEPAFKSIHT